jgi:c-di-GMP-binding flagellar brake protein YcgR
MNHEEKRAYKRSDVEQDVEDTYLEFTLEGARYRFKPLDTSSGGMGMLVTDDYPEVLEKLRVGDQIEMKYRTPESDLLMTLEVRHITQFNEGRYKGHYQVGLSY